MLAKRPRTIVLVVATTVVRSVSVVVGIESKLIKILYFIVALIKT